MIAVVTRMHAAHSTFEWQKWNRAHYDTFTMRVMYMTDKGQINEDEIRMLSTTSEQWWRQCRSACFNNTCALWWRLCKRTYRYAYRAVNVAVHLDTCGIYTSTLLCDTAFWCIKLHLILTLLRIDCSYKHKVGHINIEPRKSRTNLWKAKEDHEKLGKSHWQTKEDRGPACGQIMKKVVVVSYP